MKKKLYTHAFAFDPSGYEGEIKNVALCGEFLFYKGNLNGHTDKQGIVEHDEKYLPAVYDWEFAVID